jgi:hypothetical protein
MLYHSLRTCFATLSPSHYEPSSHDSRLSSEIYLAVFGPRSCFIMITRFLLSICIWNQKGVHICIEMNVSVVSMN